MSLLYSFSGLESMQSVFLKKNDLCFTDLKKYDSFYEYNNNLKVSA